MKVKLKIGVIAALVSSGCLSGILGFQTTKNSAITLANVEALAKYEKYESAYPCPNACLEWEEGGGGGIACDCGRYTEM